MKTELDTKLLQNHAIPDGFAIKQKIGLKKNSKITNRSNLNIFMFKQVLTRAKKVSGASTER